jgi:ADP-ribose pyrophosphatase
MTPRNPWTSLSSREQYNNPWIRVTEHQILNPAGQPGIYGVVHFKHLAIGIVPVQDGHTWLVGQHRFPMEAYTWEIPEGGGPLGEDPEDSARRELQEETGLLAREWQLIQRLQLSNSVSDELGMIYLATGLEQGPASPTEDEELEVIRVPLQEAFERVHRGELTDSLTVAGLLKLENMILKGEFKP